MLKNVIEILLAVTGYLKRDINHIPIAAYS